MKPQPVAVGFETNAQPVKVQEQFGRAHSSDGKVILRICKLGGLAGAAERNAARVKGDENSTADLPVEPKDVTRATPRWRARLPVDNADADMTADASRFAGLDDRWFWEEDFHVPRKKSCVEENAAEVAKLPDEHDYRNVVHLS